VLSQGDVTLDRLENQIGWYDARSVRSQWAFKILKIVTILAAAVIPLCAGLGGPAWVTGGLGALIVVLEGLQQLNQYHHNWITYRSTCEALKHEKYLYLASAGPYSALGNAKAVLAERVESLISQEHAKWVSSVEQAPKASKPGER
jgi:hypothetical protein